MARTVGDPSDSIGNDSEPDVTAAPLSTRGRRRPRVSGIYAKAGPPASGPIEYEPTAERSGPQKPDRQFRLAGRVVDGVVRALGGGTFMLVLSSVPPDAAEVFDRDDSLTVEVKAVRATTEPGARLPLLEIRSPLGDREAFVAGERVELSDDEMTLLALVLEASDGCTYVEMEQALWAGERVDLSRRRRTLVNRLNKELEPRVDAALERAGKHRPDKKLIRCRGGHVLLTVRAGTRV